MMIFFSEMKETREAGCSFPPKKSALKIIGERRRVEGKLDSVGVFAMELF